MSASICLAGLSPLPSQGRGQGEGSASQPKPLETPHLNPLPFTKGERRNNAEHI
jgi:hypothetical protein